MTHAVAAFDHYNLRAARPVLDELRDFYRDVVGLTVGERPPFRRFGYWLYSGEQSRAAPELERRRRGALAARPSTRSRTRPSTARAAPSSSAA